MVPRDEQSKKTVLTRRPLDHSTPGRLATTFTQDLHTRAIRWVWSDEIRNLWKGFEPHSLSFSKVRSPANKITCLRRHTSLDVLPSYIPSRSRRITI